jgi:hypothetical protein
MSVDYANPAPWNDPYNAWPATLQVYVSSYSVSPKILTMNTFDPYAAVTKINFAGAGGNVAGQLAYVNMAGIMTWTVGSPFILGGVASYATGARQLPVCYAGGPVIAWQGDDFFGPSEAQLAAITIKPVLSAVAPWEFRRRRLLEYI